MQSYTWFYSLSNKLSPGQEAALQADFDQFLGQWKTHGTPVDGLVKIAHSQFIIIQSNPGEGRPSGCSIDSLKHAVADILQKNELEALDAANVFYQNENAEVNYTHFRNISQLVESGEMNAETKIFDHSLSQSDDLSKWIVPMKQSWLKRYLPLGTGA